MNAWSSKTASMGCSVPQRQSAAFHRSAAASAPDSQDRCFRSSSLGTEGRYRHRPAGNSVAGTADHREFRRRGSIVVGRLTRTTRILAMTHSRATTRTWWRPRSLIRPRSRGLARRHLLSSLAAPAPVVYGQYRLSPCAPRKPADPELSARGVPQCRCRVSIDVNAYAAHGASGLPLCTVGQRSGANGAVSLRRRQ